MSNAKFDPNPMPLKLWILTSMACGWGCALVVAAIFDLPTSRFTIACAGAYIAVDAYGRLWGKRRHRHV